MSIDHKKNLITDDTLDDLAAGAEKVNEERPKVGSETISGVIKYISEVNEWNRNHPDDQIR